MSKVNNLTRGGIYTALTVVLVYMSNIAPTSKLSLLALASVIIPLAILTTNVKTAVLVYAASSLLCFLLNLGGVAIIYTLFFGLYGIAKYYIEKLRKLPIELILKFLVFNLSFSVMYFFYKLLFTELVPMNFSVYIIVLILEVAFFIYDYAMTSMIAFINQKFVK
jgi:hypothetical protein